MASQDSKINSTNVGLYDHFGSSVRLSGKGNGTYNSGVVDYRAIVSAPNNDYIGNVYIFRNTTEVGGTWSQLTYLSSNVSVGDQYGYAVDIVGGYYPHNYIASAPSKLDGRGAVYIFNNSYTQTHEILGPSELSYFGDSVKFNYQATKVIVGATGIGSAYILDSGNNYQLGTALQQGSLGDYFGFSVGIAGNNSSSNWSIIGAPGTSNNTGKAYIYNGTGLHTTLPLNVSGALYPSELVAGDYFGNSVALDADGNTAVVSAFLQNSQGAAHVFVRNTSTNVWTYQSKIVPKDIRVGDSFGDSVSIDSSGNTIVVGASSKLSGGAMYTFIRSGTTWTQREKIVSSNLTTGDKFGYSVSIAVNARKAIAGAYAATASSNIFSGGSAYAYSIPDNYYSGTNRIIHETAPEAEPVNTFEKFNIYINGQPVENKPVTWTDIGGPKTMSAPSTSNIFFGNVQYTTGLSTLEPGSKLHIGNFTVLNRNVYDTWDNTELDFYNEGPPSQMLSVGGDAIIENKLGIGIQNPDKPLHVLGDIRVSDNFPSGTVIDITSKSNILREVSEIIPVSQKTYEIYGYSMSMSRDGKTAVIGALQNLPGNETYGYVYVFDWNGSSWVQNTVIKPIIPISNDAFGSVISITPDGKTILVGAFRDNSVYVFKYSGTKWLQDSKIIPSDKVAGMQFGYSVDMSEDGSILAVGAPYTSVGGTVYVYSLVSGNWVETKLNPTETSSYGGTNYWTTSPVQGTEDRFGCSISMTPDGKTILIGAYNARSGFIFPDFATPLQWHNPPSAGAAFIFKFINTFWKQQIWYPGSTFPFTLHNNYEAPQVALFSHGHPTKDYPSYGYQRNGTSYTLNNLYPGLIDLGNPPSDQKLTHPWRTGTDEGDLFGWSTAISDDGNTVVIGAPGRSHPHGLPDNNVNYVEGDPRVDHGAVYIFEWVTTDRETDIPGSSGSYPDNDDRTVSRSNEWLEQKRISRPGGAIDYQYFGSEIALTGDGTTLIIGSPREGGGTHRTYSNVVESKLSNTYVPYAYGSHLGGELAFNQGENNTGSIYVYERGKSDINFIDKEKLTWEKISYYDSNLNAVNKVWPTLDRNVTKWNLKGQAISSNVTVNSFFGSSLALSGDGQSILVASGLSDGLTPIRHIPFESGSTWVHPNDGAPTTTLTSAFHEWVETTVSGEHLYRVNNYLRNFLSSSPLCKYSPITKSWSILPGLTVTSQTPYIPVKLTDNSTYAANSTDTLINPEYVYAWDSSSTLLWSFKNPYKTLYERTGTVSSYSLPDEFSKSYCNTLNVPSNLYVRDSIYTTESVGIKTSHPERPLHIDGDVRITDNTEIADFSIDKGSIYEESIITLPISGNGDIVTENDHVGERVQISGDGYTAFVSSHTHGGGFQGGGYQNPKGGKVKVYVRSGYNWTLQATLQPSDITTGDDFGISFESTPDGNKLVVSALYYSPTVTGTTYNGTGGIWVYKREGNIWSIESFFVPKEVYDGTGDTGIAYSISISDDGTRIVSGSPTANSRKGRLYIFEMSSNGIWAQKSTFNAADAQQYDRLGIEVSISGDGNTIAAGAWGADTGPSGGSANGGAIYIVKREEIQDTTPGSPSYGQWISTWNQQAKIVPSDIEDNMFFGGSCALSSDGNTLAIGARDADHPDTGNNIGAAYVFVRSGGEWSQEAKLFPNDPYVGWSSFAPTNGLSISSDGNRIAVGRAQPAFTKYPGVYIFDREYVKIVSHSYLDPSLRPSSIRWSQVTKLTPSDGNPGEFGYSVALSSVGDRVIVGDIIKEINGISRAGAAYIYNLPVVDDTTLNISSSIRSRGGLKVYNDTGIGTLDPGKKLHVVGDIRLSSQNENVDLSVIPESTTQEYKLTIASQYSRYISNKDNYKPEFGRSSSISYDGNIAVVGAPFDNYVYVFKRSGTVWTEQAKLTSSNVFTDSRSIANGETSDQFGYDVAISGDGKTIAVGTKTTNTNENADSGRVYIFTNAGYKWIEETEIMQPAINGASIGYGSSGESGFGLHVALSENGNHLAVSAPYARTYNNVSTGYYKAGAVFMYYRHNGIWFLEDSLHASSPQDGWDYPSGTGGYGAANFAGYDNTNSLNGDDEDYDFGCSISISANGWKIAVGAERAEDRKGIVFIFERGDYLNSPSWQTYDGTTTSSEKKAGYKLVSGYFYPQVSFPTAAGVNLKKWAQRQKITKVENSTYYMSRTTGDRFGTTVCLSGDGNVLAVGTRESSPSTDTTPGRWSSTSLSQVGRVYMYNFRYGVPTSNAVHISSGIFVPYDYDGNVTTTLISIGDKVPRRLWTTNETSGGGFGSAIALSYTGHVACVGASGEDSLKFSGSPVDYSGMAYIFTSGDPNALLNSDSWVGSSYGSNQGLQRKWSLQPERVVPRDIVEYGSFGTSVCMDKNGTRAFIGAPRVSGSGAGYVFNISSDRVDKTIMNMSSSLQFPTGKYIEFGSDMYQKESNAGKIGMNLFSKCLDIVGYTGFETVGQYSDRSVRVWDKLGVGSSHPYAQQRGVIHIYEPVGSSHHSTNDASLVLEHGDSGGSSCILFPSARNVNSDYGYIQYEDSTSSGDEKSQLIIGTQNDGPGSNEDNIILSATGKVGIKTDTPQRTLDVNGDSRFDAGVFLNWSAPTLYLQDTDHKSSMIHCNNSNFYILNGSGTNSVNWSTASTGRYALIINLNNNDFLIGGTAYANGYNYHSDARIKKDIVDIDDTSALEKLRLIQPKTYKYRNEEERGSSTVYGFIAQDISNVLPYAVSITADVVPTILSSSNVTALTDTSVQLTLDKTIPDDINLTNTSNIHITVDGVGGYVCPVISTTGNNIITIEKTSELSNITSTSTAYIFGEHVQDFHNIDKSAIFTIATAALQEVDRQLQSEKTKVSTLETQVADLLARVTALENN